MAAKRPRPRASEHRRVHIHVRHMVVEVQRVDADVSVLLLRKVLSPATSHRRYHWSRARCRISQEGSCTMVSMVLHEEEATPQPRPLCAASQRCTASLSGTRGCPRTWRRGLRPRERPVTLAGLSLVLQWCAVTACSVQVCRMWTFPGSQGAHQNHGLQHEEPPPPNEGRGTLTR